MIHPQFSINDEIAVISSHLESLINDGGERENLIKGISRLRSILTGFAADNAAELIGNDIATWSVKKKAKGSQPA